MRGLENTSASTLEYIKSLVDDHYLSSDHKKRNRALAQFAAASFIIPEIMRCRLHSNKLSWRRTRFKLVAYMSNLLGSNNVKYSILAKKMKVMLVIAGPS